MSKISLKHSGGNVVSLNSPTSAPTSSDVAFKLPNADGTSGQAIVTDASGNLSFGSTGKILQVVQTVKTSKQTIQSTSLTDIAGMSVTITPSSSSNKVLISYSLIAFTNGNQYWSMRLLRGSSDDIFIGDINSSATSQQRASFGGFTQSYVEARCIAQEFLDSPNTTSATTYKLQAHTPYSSNYIIGINSSPTLDNYTYMNNCVSTITAMEVAA
tara:strand:+ start:1256 stop:1897 length:642 start_codon:yes stop_codon:yes gene_type:complete